VLSRGDILALVAIILIISAFAYYAYQQYTFSRTGRVILVEYRASKAWRKGDTWYFQSQSFSAGHVASYNVFAAFKITGNEVRYVKLLLETNGSVNYIDITTGKEGSWGEVDISGGKHIVELFYNKTALVRVKIDGKDIEIEEYGRWEIEKCIVTVFSSSYQKHSLTVRFLEIRS